MKIERRLPFGFVGDWGMLYKRFIVNEDAVLKENEIVTYENNIFRDIGMDVQFKLVADASLAKGQDMAGRIYNDSNITVETTDAYFNDDTKNFNCVVSPGDVIKVLGRFWTCESITTKSKFVPAKHDYFYCKLKEISLR